MVAEFKEFISRGNMVDLAVAFVLGIAFQSVIAVITGRVLTPLIGMLFGEPNLDTLLTFGAIDPDTGMPVGSIGAVFTALLNFLLVALALFVVAKAYNRMKRSTAAEPEPQAEPEDVALLREIRDTLRQRRT